MTVRAESPPARRAMATWLAEQEPELLDCFKATARYFGPTSWAEVDLDDPIREAELAAVVADAQRGHGG